MPQPHLECDLSASVAHGQLGWTLGCSSSGPRCEPLRRHLVAKGYQTQAHGRPQVVPPAQHNPRQPSARVHRQGARSKGDHHKGQGGGKTELESEGVVAPHFAGIGLTRLGHSEPPAPLAVAEVNLEVPSRPGRALSVKLRTSFGSSASRVAGGTYVRPPPSLARPSQAKFALWLTALHRLAFRMLPTLGKVVPPTREARLRSPTLND